MVTNPFLMEKEMATHSCFLAQEMPWTEEPGWATDHGVRQDLVTEQQ